MRSERFRSVEYSPGQVFYKWKSYRLAGRVALLCGENDLVRLDGVSQIAMRLDIILQTLDEVIELPLEWMM